MLYELGLRTVPVVPLPPGVSLEPLGKDEISDYLGLRPEVQAAHVSQRFQRRHLCFSARFEGRVIAASWVALEQAWIDYLDCEFPLAEGEAYIYDAFTSERWRGCGLGSALSTHITRHLLERGLKKSWRAVMPENHEAVALQVKLGSRPVLLLKTLRLGRWTWRGRSTDWPTPS